MRRISKYHLWQIIIGACLLLWTILSMAATLNASIDKSQVGLNESFNLTLQLDGSASGVPNLNPLQKNFVIISTSKSTQYSLINGKGSATTAWVIGLAPKNTGLQQIPAIHIGNVATSNPLSIEVTAASNSPAVNAKNASDIFMEVTTTPKHVYVGSQIHYRLRIFAAQNLLQPMLSLPTATNASIRLLGNGTFYQVTQNNRTYQVTERDFSITPTQPGIVKISAPILTGDVPVAPTANSIFNNPFASLNGKPVRVSAKTVTINVLPIPKNIDPDNWLPAHNLQLSQKWSDSYNNWHVGDPITRTVTIRAQGVAADQLPSITWPSNDTSFKLYKDKGQSENLVQGDWLIGTKTEKVAIIPTTPGKLTLPAVKVPWWNTKTQTAQVATLPPVTVNILPAVAGSTPAAVASVPSHTAKPVDKSLPTAQVVNQATTNVITAKNNNQHWIWLALCFAGLWVITLFAWWWQRRRKIAVTAALSTPELKPLSLKKATQAVLLACDQNNPAVCKDQVLAWARIQYADKAIHSLHDVASATGDKTLAQEFLLLDQALYSSSVHSWQGARLKAAFSKFKIDPKLKTKQVKATLPPLYPEER